MKYKSENEANIVYEVQIRELRQHRVWSTNQRTKPTSGMKYKSENEANIEYKIQIRELNQHRVLS
jgi:hypothetical protein